MHTEIVKQINQLPPVERVEIIEEVSRVLRREMDKGVRAPISEQEKERRREAIERLRGIASVPGKRPPTDEEVKQGYADYLAEKYK